MLASMKLLGFALTKDATRSREFYEKVLGFNFLSQDQFALVMKTEQNMIRISPVKEFTPAQHTIMGWQVTQIEKVADELAKRGVTFETYPGLTLDKYGVWASPSGDKVAWFKDPDGNLLSISQHVTS